MPAMITITSQDLQGILEDMNTRDLIESFSYSKYNGIDIEWNVHCDSFEWEVEDAVTIDEYDQVKDELEDVRKEYEQLDECHQQLKQDYEQLKEQLQLVTADKELCERERNYLRDRPFLKRIFG
jgi:predicted nuclease with TOPRIM domain